MKLFSRLKSFLPMILLAAGLYLLLAIALKILGLDNIHRWIAQTGAWAPVVFFSLCTLSLVIAPLSGSSIFIAGGILFGKDLGFLLSWLATILGCSLNFWISRRLGRSIAARLIGKRDLDQFDGFLQKLRAQHSIFYIILLMPLSQDLVSYAVGLTKVPYWQFLIALAVSGLVVVGTYVYLGTGLLEWLL